MHAVGARQRQATRGAFTVRPTPAPRDPDLIPIPIVTSQLIDRIIEDEQRLTGDEARIVRRRIRKEILDMLERWAVERQVAP